MASLQKNTGTRVERKTSNPPSPLPEKIALVLQESRWLALIVLAAFLGLALWGYNRADPGWSHAMQGASLHNPAGRGGAWLADLLLYLFGVSAWWWIVLLLAVVWWGYRRLDGLRTADRRPMYIALAGFFLNELGCCGFLLALQGGGFALALFLEGVIVLVGEQADA